MSLRRLSPPKAFLRDRRGVSAVEFALVLPLMLVLLLGGVEISRGIGVDRKVTLTTRTVADLSSQASKITNADMTNIMNASTAVMSPYTTGPLKIVVSLVNIDANKKATIGWSDTLNGSAHAVGSAVTLPDGLNVASTSLIWSEVTYTYTPTFGLVLTGPLNLSDQIYMRPRLSDSVSRSAT